MRLSSAVARSSQDRASFRRNPTLVATPNNLRQTRREFPNYRRLELVLVLTGELPIIVPLKYLLFLFGIFLFHGSAGYASSDNPIREAETLRLQGKGPESLALIDNWLARHPNDVDALIERTIILGGGTSQQLLDDYNHILVIDPSNAAILNNRANLYAETGKHALALKDYDEAIDIAPKSAICFNRGKLKEKMCNYSWALADITQAFKLAKNKPERARCAVARIRLFQLLSDSKSAQREFRKAQREDLLEKDELVEIAKELESHPPERREHARQSKKTQEHSSAVAP